VTTLYIHVNQHVIRRNKKTGEREPPITVRRGTHGKSHRVQQITVEGPVTFRYMPDDPLPCGAQVWAEGPSGHIISTAGER
jgi:hypothetical protein